jgi:SAM-dependent methyltransferase
MSKIDFWKDIEGYDKYTYSTDRGKKRIEEMEKYFKQIKPFLSGGKSFLKGKILDIGCGGGIFSFWLETKGYTAVGIDNNKSMIKIALGEKKKHKFKTKFIHGDAETVKIDGRFDSFLNLGNTLPTIPLISFVNILKNLDKNLKERGFVIISYNDSLKSFLKREPYFIFTSKDLVNIYGNYSNSDNSIELISISFKGRGMIKTKFYLWSSHTLQALMWALGFKLVERIDAVAEDATILDTYQKM